MLWAILLVLLFFMGTGAFRLQRRQSCSRSSYQGRDRDDPTAVTEQKCSFVEKEYQKGKLDE
ncbi:MAG: hypothetical protein EHM48_05395 [Planctomycetaceae bacterium]|nr:MAG: hypothetical protein EHM48_05395 [Planctomycetaceae bacterium]